MNNEEKTSAAISDRLRRSNRAYFDNLKILKNELISKNIKLKNYKKIVWRVLMVLNDGSSHKMTWRRLEDSNSRLSEEYMEQYWWIHTIIEIIDILQILNSEDIVNFMKYQTPLKRGHVSTMEGSMLPGKEKYHCSEDRTKFCATWVQLKSLAGVPRSRIGLFGGGQCSF